MALSTVTLTGDLADLIQSGIAATITLTPTAVLTDTTDHIVIPQVARSRVFTGGTFTLPGIIACDNSAITPAGWAYTITVTLANGTVLLTETAFINFANGATQDLSSLIPVSSAVTMQGYTPLPVYAVPSPTGLTATDTAAVAAVITKLTTAGGNGTLVFADGTYQVDGNALVIRSCSNFTVKGSGATVITQAPNTASKPNNTSGDLLIVADCTDFRVQDITLDGLRDTVSPLTPLTATASSGQPSVTVAAGQGANYQAGQHLNLYGGLGTADQNQSDTGKIISTITPGGGSGGGDLITFTANLASTYSQASSTVFSDGYGPYAYAGDYLTPYQTGIANTVAGRTLHGEDQQNGLHLISCKRFTVTRVTGRNLWESGVKCGTGFASTLLTDGCSEGAITDCVTYHGYDQGVSLWMSSAVSVTGCTADAAGWAGVSLSASDHCTVIGNKILNSVYRVPGDNASGTGIAIEGGRSNHVKGNIITGPYSDGMRLWTSPLEFGLTGSNNPTTSAFLAAQTPAGTSVQVSATANLVSGGLYSILDGGYTEAVTVTITDGTHVTFSDVLQFAHASGCYLVTRVPQDNSVEGNTIYGPLNANGILHQTAVRSRIRGNTIKNYGLSGTTGRGINLQTSTTGAINLPSGAPLAGQGTIIEGNTIGGGAGSTVYASLSDTLAITGNRLWGTAANATSTVIDLQGVRNSVVSGNQIAGTGTSTSNGSGIHLQASAGTNCARLTITGNVISRTANEGIIALLGDSLTITGNMVTSCGGNAGINVRGVTNSVIADNIAISNKGAGIQLEDQSGVFCLYNRVTGNTTRDDGTGINYTTGAAQTQQHGIVEKGTSNSNLFAGNESDSNAVDQLTTVGAATLVFGNIISTAIAVPPLLPANNLSDLASASTARTNLGLGAAALLAVPIPAADLPTLDLITAPAAAVSLNSQKITTLANGSGAQDAAAFGQLPSGSNLVPIASGGTGQATDPLQPWMPSDSGYLAWNFDPGQQQNGTALINNTLYLVRVNIRKAMSVTNVIVYITSGGTGLVSNENFAGLYASSGTLTATTADQTAGFTSGGLRTMALSGGPYALTAGTFVWVAILANESAGTVPSFLRAGGVSSSALEAGLTVSTARWATNGTGTSLSSITPASNVNTGISVWVALS